MLRSDPFGLASATTQVSGRTALTVYPHIDRIRSMPDTQGPDPHNGAGHPIALSQTGEDAVSREIEFCQAPDAEALGRISLRQGSVDSARFTDSQRRVRAARRTTSAARICKDSTIEMSGKMYTPSPTRTISATRRGCRGRRRATACHRCG